MRFLLPVIISLFLVSSVLNAQQKVEEIKIKEVKGIAIGGDRESVDQLIQLAINEAKVEALKN